MVKFCGLNISFLISCTAIAACSQSQVQRIKNRKYFGVLCFFRTNIDQSEVVFTLK
jgi:hypothetical protein